MVWYYSVFFVVIMGTYLSKETKGSLLVGSFNVQNLGNRKLSNENVMEIVRKIILRYDVILIQEIVTKEQNRIRELLNSINRVSDSGEEYGLKLSKRLGRGNAKEQYGYFFRTDKVRVLSDQVYPDKNDDFMRPPYIVHFSTETVNGLSSFVMIGIHTQPKNAADEISSLIKVYEYSRKRYNTEDIIILGDLNAGCSSVRNRDWSTIELWVNPKFEWLIGSDVDTTTNPNDCPYDRIIVTGNNIKGAIVPKSAKAFNFQRRYKLTDEQAKNVSDHYPVEVSLGGGNN